MPKNPCNNLLFSNFSQFLWFKFRVIFPYYKRGQLLSIRHSAVVINSLVCNGSYFGPSNFLLLTYGQSLHIFHKVAASLQEYRRDKMLKHRRRLLHEKAASHLVKHGESPSQSRTKLLATSKNYKPPTEYSLASPTLTAISEEADCSSSEESDYNGGVSVHVCSLSAQTVLCGSLSGSHTIQLGH